MKFYMVNSNLVVLSCYVNVVIMTLLLLGTSSAGSYISYDLCHASMYICGVFFNTLVLVYANRKLDALIKDMEYCLHKVRITAQKVYHLVTGHYLQLKTSLRQALSASGAISEIFELNRMRNLFCFRRSSDETKKLYQSLHKASNRKTVPEESVTTPEFNCFHNLRPISRPQSDPIKKIARSNSKEKSHRNQSPELFKNKIYKSRMNLASDFDLPRMTSLYLTK